MSVSDKEMIYKYIRSRVYGVQATTDRRGIPQAAVVGFAVTPELELVFDTEKTTRKYLNFLTNPVMAFVIGWDSDSTLQLEGLARESSGEDLTKLKKIYFEKFPDGTEREKWPNIVYLAIKPYWIRLTNYTTSPENINEWSLN